MKSMEKLRFIMPFWFLVIAAAFSTIVMMLWNWLVPSIFGLTEITFWQALGLFTLARIFFGSFGFFSIIKGMHDKMHQGMGGHPLHKKWLMMTPEQRKEFIEKRRKMGFKFHHHFDMEEYVEEEQGVEKK